MAEKNMLRPAINQLSTRGESYYSLVIGVAKRAREISDEIVKQELILTEKPVKTAIDEFACGKYVITDKQPVAKPAPAPVVPVEPEEEEQSDETIGNGFLVNPMGIIPVGEPPQFQRAAE